MNQLLPQQIRQIDVLRSQVWEKHWCGRSGAWEPTGSHLYGYLGGQILNQIQFALGAGRRDVYSMLFVNETEE